MAKTEIDVDDDLLDELSESFFWEEYHDRSTSTDHEGLSRLIVARVDGLSIKIWADEHPPPHFHVSYQGQDASFSILDCSRLPGVSGLQRYDRRIESWWRRNRMHLIKKWNASRPTNCSVGPIILPGDQRENHI